MPCESSLSGPENDHTFCQTLRFINFFVVRGPLSRHLLSLPDAPPGTSVPLARSATLRVMDYSSVQTPATSARAASNAGIYPYLPFIGDKGVSPYQNNYHIFRPHF